MDEKQDENSQNDLSIDRLSILKELLQFIIWGQSSKNIISPSIEIHPAI